MQRRRNLTTVAVALALVAALVPGLVLADDPNDPGTGLAGPPVELVAGEYIIGFHDLSLEADELADGQWEDYPVVRTNEALGTVLVEVANPVAFTLDARTHDNVAYTEWDDPIAFVSLFTPNDPRYPDQYGYPQIEAPAAWDTQLGSSAVKVAVVDSGVEAAHEDLAGRVVAQHDFVDNDGTANDQCGHGTHVAGTVAAISDNGVGVAGTAQVSILAAKALAPLLILCSGSNADVADAITWSTDQGAHVISMSLGGGSSTTTRNAVQYADQNGVLLVAAAGNDGPCSDCVGFPAAYDEVMAVTCTEQGEAQCSFSSDGPESEISAPGAAVWSTYTNNGYRSLSGTSMSTPHVSGVAALVFSQNDTLSADQVRSILTNTAQDLGATGWDEQFGHGEVDAAATVAAAGGGGGGTDPDPQCSDGVDNDGDGLIDHPDDPGCSSADDDDESDDPPPPPSGGLSEDFESGATGWTVSDNGGPATWQLTTARSQSPTHAMAIRNYGAGEDDTLVSPEVDLAGISEPELTLRSWMEGERACFIFCTIYDAGTIQVTSDGGASWRTLQSNYWSSGGWETLTFSLSQEAGEIVQVRFVFESDGSVHNEGWYLDDVVIG